MAGNDGKAATPPPDASITVSTVKPPPSQSEASKAYHAKAARDQRKAAKAAEQTAQAQARYQANAKTYEEHELVRPRQDADGTGGVIGVLAPVQIDKLPEYFDEVHGSAMALGADCRRCPMRLAGTGPVLHEIRPGAKLTVIGEAPGVTEVKLGRPNAGWSGNILNIAMSVGDIVREDTTMANVVMCSAPDEMSYSELMETFAIQHKRACRQAKILNQPEPPAPLTPDIACRGALRTAIEHTGAPVLLTLGKQALEATTRTIGVPYDKDKHSPDDTYVATLAHQHGAPVWFPPEVSARAGGAKVLLAAYHPAYAAREKKEWLPAIMDVITRAAKAASTDLAALAWNEFCEKCWIEPSVEEIIEFCRVALERNLEVTVDVETDGPDRVRATLRLIQFAMMVDGVEWAINIPIRHMDGSPWWATPSEVERFKPWVVRVLDELPIAGQFLQYDTAVLLRSEGWMTNDKKSWTDLTILYRATRDNDLPKNLAAIVSRLHPAPRWKKDVDFKSLDNVDDRHLLKYGIKDVIYEMRCLEPLRKRVDDCASWAPVKIDTDLLPVWRDMGLLGLVVNEHERGEYSRTFNRAVSWLTCDFQNRVGKKINPNSVDQLQDLIFGEWGYRPVILPDGTELDDSTTAIWDDEELGSTSSAALIQLQKRRAVQPQHASAIDTLFELRAYQKLRGTYTDNINVYDEDTEEWNRDVPRVPAVREMRITADKHNVFQHWEETECLPERGLFSRLLPVYLSHTIPTGRAASQGPNVQNIPAAGKANMRTMLVAPPGHVIVGADFDQLEARIYAALTGDRKILQAIKENLDIHSMNAATLLAKSESEFWPWYHKVADSNAALKKGDKDKGAFAKYWRTVAKRFAFLCIEEGTLVLTDRGEVPIEAVRDDDLLWDGVEWVKHDGVVCRGEKETIEYDGLCATEDHEVWVEDGRKMQLGEAAKRRLPLARGAIRGEPVRFVGDVQPGLEKPRALQSRRDVYGLQHPEGAVSRKHSCREVAWMQVVHAPKQDYARVVADQDDRSTAALHESEQSSLASLRRARNRIQVSEQRGCRTLGSRQLGASEGNASRSNQQRRALRAGQSSLGYLTREQHESKQHEASCELRVPFFGVAVQREGRVETSARWQDAGSDHRVREDLRSSPTELVAHRRGTARVYDILNAGPRHRFVAAGKVVSNCIYGGEVDILWDVMSNARDRATGKLSFPELTLEDVLVWHERWHRDHPETREWHESSHDAMSETGYSIVPGLDCRKRWFPGGPSKVNAVPNMLVQGLAASIANRAMLAIAEAIPFRSWSRWTGLSLQVHDYLQVYVPVSRYEEAMKIVNKCMPWEFRGVPITAEAQVSWTLAQQG